MTGTPWSSFPESGLSSNATPIASFNATWPGRLAMACCSGSLFGSLMIILTYLAFRDIRSTSRQILAYLSIANVGTSAAIIWGVAGNYQDSNSVGCQTQSVVLIATGVAEFLWNIALALYLYVIITREGSKWGHGGCPTSLYFICWLPGIAVALVAYLKDQTGVDSSELNTAEWCIIRGPQRNDLASSRRYAMWSMVVGDGWNILAIFSTFIFYLLTKYHIYKETHHHQSTLLTRGALNAASQIDRKLTFIPLTYFCLHIWSFVRTVLALSVENINKDIHLWWYELLLGLQTIGDCSDGVANAVIFLVFSPKLRHRLKAAVLSRLFHCWYRCKSCRCCRSEDSGSEAMNSAVDSHYAQRPGSEAAERTLGASGGLSRYHWTRSTSPHLISMGTASDKETAPLLGSRVPDNLGHV